MGREIPTTMIGLKRELNRCEELNNNLDNSFNGNELMFLRGAIWALKWLCFHMTSPSKAVEGMQAVRQQREAPSATLRVIGR